MSSGRRRPAAGRGSRNAVIPPPIPSHPAWWLAVAAIVACIPLAVTYRNSDPDLWQHLTVGKVIWAQHRAPTEQLWSWPTYGSIDVTSSYSWLFRALLWPCWRLAGENGLFVWRWVTTLAAFTFAWLAARRMGARGYTTWIVFALAALVYRQRAQVRPETLAAVLLALEVWILEVRRQGGKDRSVWLVPLLWVWVNAHISYYLGFLLIGIHLIGDLWRGQATSAAERPSTRRLLIVSAIAILAVFVNPYGWRAVWQPFDFALHLRNEPLFRSIGELRPISWHGDNLRNGLLLFVVGWPLLVIGRAIRSRFDVVAAMTCALFTTMVMLGQRFMGVYVLVAATYVAPDLERAIAGLRVPPWLRSDWLRGLATAATIVGLLVLIWIRTDLPLGLGFEWRAFPVAACDFMANAGVRGRGFTPFHFGGYLLWRFWPEKDRLPFMDIHQSGTPEIRTLYSRVFSDPAAWDELERRYRFDYVLLPRVPVTGETLLDRMDADSTWSLVFLDDAAALWVSRSGRMASLARTSEYRWLAASGGREAQLVQAAGRDSAIADSLRAELTRNLDQSRWDASAWFLLGWIAARRHETERAGDAFARGARINDGLLPGVHAMLAQIALQQGRPKEALREVAAERKFQASIPVEGQPQKLNWEAPLDVLEGRVWRALGDRARARRLWERALRRDPGQQEARDSLDALVSVVHRDTSAPGESRPGTFTTRVAPAPMRLLCSDKFPGAPVGQLARRSS